MDSDVDPFFWSWNAMFFEQLGPFQKDGTKLQICVRFEKLFRQRGKQRQRIIHSREKFSIQNQVSPLGGTGSLFFTTGKTIICFGAILARCRLPQDTVRFFLKCFFAWSPTLLFRHDTEASLESSVTCGSFSWVLGFSLLKSETAMDCMETFKRQPATFWSLSEGDHLIRGSDQSSNTHHPLQSLSPLVPKAISALNPLFTLHRQLQVEKAIARQKQQQLLAVVNIILTMQHSSCQFHTALLSGMVTGFSVVFTFLQQQKQNSSPFTSALVWIKAFGRFYVD